MKRVSVLNFDIGNIGVHVSMGGFANIGDKAVSTVHSHADFEYHTVMRGEAEIELEKDKVSLKENDVILIFPDTFHKFLKSERESAVLSFVFSIRKNRRGQDYHKIISERLSGDGFFVMRENHSAVEWLRRIVANTYSKNPFAAPERRSCLSLILTQLFTALSSDKGTEVPEQDDYEQDTRIYIIEEYFNEHYMENITLGALAESLYLGEKQTERIIKKIYGTGFRERLTKIRIKSAVELLLESDVSVKEIAERVGYDSYNGFYSAFKRKTGKTPDEYRKNKA